MGPTSYINLATLVVSRLEAYILCLLLLIGRVYSFFNRDVIDNFAKNIIQSKVFLTKASFLGILSISFAEYFQYFFASYECLN
jgi:hypothetical protein